MMRIQMLFLSATAIMAASCSPKPAPTPPAAMSSGHEVAPAQPAQLAPQSQSPQPAPESSSSAASTPSASPAAPPERVIKPFPGIAVHMKSPADSFVEVEATVCLDEGFLEQVACSPNTREHESLVVVQAKPSQIHAALLMAGFTPGSPGQWTFNDNKLGTINPTGDKLDVIVRYVSASGRQIEQPIRQWIRGAVPQASGENSDHPATHVEFPNLPWVFGGSSIEPNPKFMGPGEHYVADMSGSIIGLVTFGDETIGFSQVISDQEDVQAPEWEINTEVIPPIGTPVTLILQRFTGE